MFQDGKAFDSVAGIAATSLGLITSLQENLEYNLRITSLILGIAVGFVSLYRIIRKL